MNDNENKHKIDGVSITKKRKAFNCKFATRFNEHQPDFIETFLTQLPAYFGNSKFMKNNERKIQFQENKNIAAVATYIPYHLRTRGGETPPLKKMSRQNNKNSKPPMIPKVIKN